MINHYLVLGVNDFSTHEVVKKQYRKLAKIYHPDKSPNNKAAESKFKEIAHSYGILSNPDQKKALDYWLEGKTFQVKQLSHAERSAFAKKKREAFKKHEIETRYNLYQNSILTIKVRVAIAIFSMSAIFSFFLLNYFPNYENPSNLIYLAFSGLLFAAFIYLLVDAYYVSIAFKTIKKNKNTDSAIQYASYLFIALFFASPILGSISANIRRVTLLNYKTLEAKPLEISKDKIDSVWTFRFYANYQSYTCKTDGAGLEGFSKDELIVNYYPGDPRICELVNKK